MPDPFVFDARHPSGNGAQLGPIEMPNKLGASVAPPSLADALKLGSIVRVNGFHQEGNNGSFIVTGGSPEKGWTLERYVEE